MSTSSRIARILSAAFAAVAVSTVFAGAALAHPESEGEHPGGCIVTAEPGTIADGDQFTVEGNFGGASIFIVPGDGVIDEDREPDATTPQGDSFSVTFTALGPGNYTVWGMIVGSECGDSDTLVVNPALPDTAMEAPSVSASALQVIGLLLVAMSATLGAFHLARAWR